jgi:uncharacterized protein YacL
MLLNILRGLFILMMAAVGYAFLDANWVWIYASIAVGGLFVCIDILAPRQKLALFSGTFFALIVGIIVAYALTYVTGFMVDFILSATDTDIKQRDAMVRFVNLIVGVICCYLTISLVLQTKDDFRFIIPYVEFTKQTKGARPMLVDTSVLIDGRISDIASTGVLESQIIVPRFVLDELQGVADSADKMKRNRGRRGLDVLAKLQVNKRVDVILYAHSAREEDAAAPVDQRLMDLTKELNGRVLTTDYNLNKVAQLRGVDVININDLANALKPVVLPGERMNVRVVKPGEEAGQGVGYLEDGTMVVVEQGRPHMNEEIEFTVTSALQTSAGRMIFGRLAAAPNTPGGPPVPQPDAHPPSHSHPPRRRSKTDVPAPNTSAGTTPAQPASLERPG